MRSVHLRLGLFTLTFIFLFSVAPATSSEIFVPDDYQTIQEAINAAVEGDTIIVRPGTYPESVNFEDKVIEVKSLNGAETTIIEGEVVVSNQGDSESVLDGFTVQENPANRAGIQIYRSSPIVRNNIIRDHSHTGISITNDFCSPTIVNNIIRNNSSPFSGGGIFMLFADPKIVGNTFLNNHSPAEDIFNGGGGIAIGEYSGPIIESNTFIGNTSLYQGGAIHASFYFNEIILSNNVFFANSAVRGSALSVTDTYFDDVQSRGSNELVISNNLFIGNHAEDAGVIHQESGQDTFISNCTFSGNDTGSVLGRINSPVVENCIFWGNGGPVSTGSPSISFSLVEGGYPGEGNIDADPLFASGPLGECYLSQVAAGQAADSPCVDSGSDSASQICFQLHDREICLDELTTRTDLGGDTGQADMGYHYAPTAAPLNCSIIAGLGPHQSNPSTVRMFPPQQDAEHDFEFSAYSVAKYGVNVCCGELDGEPGTEIITGPGPGAVFGPHVRGFAPDGTQLPGLSFLAYGTNKFGVNVAAGDLDNDGFDEILTGAGPGAVFGPHVRAFDFDGGPTVTPVAGVSFFAYGTLKWGVNVAAGDLDGDGYDEIVTGAGPGTVFGPHVRGWNVDSGTAAAISGISFFAYNTPRFGVVVGCGDVDGDGIDEIITAPGPAPAFGSHIRGWNYDGGTLGELPGLSFFAWPAGDVRYGAKVWAGTDLDADGRCEIIVGSGPGPGNGSTVKVYDYQDQQVTLDFTFDAFPSVYTHGVNVAAGQF